MTLFIDGLIIFLYFVAIILIGLYMGRRGNTLRDFALGNRQVPWWAVMCSIIAAETSAATFLGAPGEGYETRSLAYVQLVVGVIIGRIFVGYFFLRPYYLYKVYTVYDYLGIRFGPITKGYVSALFLLMRTLASGTRLFVPSVVIVLAWQLFHSRGGKIDFNITPNIWWYVIAITGLTLLTCLYTAIGGIKAVIWTDVIQATLMFGSALIAIATLLWHIGGRDLASGFHTLVQYVPQMKKPEGYFITGFEHNSIQFYKNMNQVSVMKPLDYVWMILASPYTIFSALIASTVSNIAAFGTDQDMVQRLLTAETYKKSRRSLITAALMDIPIGTAFTFIGILLYVFYQQHAQYRPQSNADVFAAYILNVMTPGVRGIVLAGVFATAMGSLSAALNALATSATNDWYIPYFARQRSEAHHVAAARVFTVIFSILMIAIACAFAWAKVSNPNVRIIPVVLGIAGFILGPMLGVFLLGMFTKRRGSDLGNIIAITLGLCATIYLGGLHNDLLDLIGLHQWTHRPIITVSFTWFALVGAVVVCAVGLFFRTPEGIVEEARRRRAEADQGADVPIALRGEANDRAFEVVNTK